MTADDVPPAAAAAADLPQQAVVSAFRKYTKSKGTRNMQRIGVFVCHCGTNIAGTVDVKAVAAALGNEPGVVVAEDYQYMCSQAGQDLIKKAIRENNLNGVVI